MHVPPVILAALIGAAVCDFLAGAVYIEAVWVVVWLLVNVGIMAAVFVYAWLRSRRPGDRETRCRRCGYILRGITEPRCPECGERI